MKKYSIKIDGKYLKEFEPNESYVTSGRVIGNTGLHSQSEYNAVVQGEPKYYDSRTAKDYFANVIECIRWDGLNAKKIEVDVKCDD